VAKNDVRSEYLPCLPCFTNASVFEKTKGGLQRPKAYSASGLWLHRPVKVDHPAVVEGIDTAGEKMSSQHCIKVLLEEFTVVSMEDLSYSIPYGGRR
jgi:hypothetical protein